MKSYLNAVRAVIWKDLTAEWRTRENLSAMLVFALLVILIFNFALELDIQAQESLSAGVLWATFIFAGTIGLNRSMAVEKDRDCLDGMLGELVLTTPCTWLEEFTPREKWLGGLKIDGENMTTLDGLRARLEPRFSMIAEPRDVEFVIRETARKFQHTASQLTAWRMR